MSAATPSDELDYYRGLSEDELVKIILSLPDGENYPLPAGFYKKYNLNPAKAVSFKDYAMSKIWLKRQFEDKDLPALELKPEDLPKEVAPYVVLPEVKADVVTTTTTEN